MTQILQTKRFIHDGDFQPNQNEIDNANQTAVPTNPESSITSVWNLELMVESMIRHLMDTGQISGLELFKSGIQFSH